MQKTYQELQKYLKFDNLIQFLDEQFQAFPDHRTNNSKYPLADVLKAAFAMFSLKSSSLLDFKKQSAPEESNLRSIYRIKGEIPCDNQMRVILDKFSPEYLRGQLSGIFSLLKKSGLLAEYKYWQKSVIVSIDATEHFSSTKVHCANCTKKKLRNGKISYQHSALGAVLVHPDKPEVFVLDVEPIVNQDGVKKNDCERNAAKRLIENLAQTYPEMAIILVEDALYANAPHIRQIREKGYDYILNIKPDSHKSLFKQFEGRRNREMVKEMEQTDRTGVKHKFSWTNGLWLGETTTDVQVNVLMYEQTDRKGKVTRWSWITNLKLSVLTIEKVMKAARARWKIENETFNTLKNQGYNFKHNYGHGEKNLATVLMLIMMQAFLIDQIQQRYSETFRKLQQGLGSRKKLWASIRSAFQMIKFRTMQDLHYHIFYVYQLE
jgi:hypothetical protein